jgi:hypothetical protein
MRMIQEHGRREWVRMVVWAAYACVCLGCSSACTLVQRVCTHVLVAHMNSSTAAKSMWDPHCSQQMPFKSVTHYVSRV